MRIISGTFRGRRLSPPKNITARPTTDFAKESLFNLLNNRMDLSGIHVLDLFSGTGSIALECVSRGAKDVVAVELAHVQQNFIIQTCKQLDIHNLTVIRGDVFRFLNACHAQYDLVFADPPYALDKLPMLPDLIFRDGFESANMPIIKQSGLFVLEHSANHSFTSHPHFMETREYGNVHFSFFA